MPQSRTKSKSEPVPVYVLKGKDDSLVGAQTQMLLDELIEPSQRVTGLLDVDGKDVLLSVVLDELRTLPFLADRRVVVVRNADDFISKDHNRQLLEKYFDRPSPTGILVLVVRNWTSTTRLARKLSKMGRLIDVTPPKGQELSRRLAGYAREAHEKVLNMNTAELLVDLLGDDLPRLYSEIDKLAVYAPDDKAITAEHIEALTGHNRILGAFEVIDAIIAARPAQAVDRLRRMFADDKSSEYTVVGAFAFHLRRMFQAKVMLDKGTFRGTIEKSLRIWSNKERFFAQIQQMSLTRIGGYLQRLGRTDYDIKTGKTKATVAMEQLVLELSLR
ncbi:MAG: DNA polymerase III subunit delta [Sedimentisphaerales bacterium]|nr:DNA polymerase III subunit delta [Sedimentisphaerales bacterium]